MQEKRQPTAQLPLTAEDLLFNPPGFALSELAGVAERYYGLTGTLTALDGERDQNARLVTSDGPAYVLKVSGQDESPEVVDFQTQALLHLEAQAPGLPVPRVCRTRDGLTSVHHDFSDRQTYQVRLLTYLPGVPLALDRMTDLRIVRNIGALQGRLCRALRGFFHPAARHFMAWDIGNGLAFDEGLRAGLSPELQELTAPFMARLQGETLPRLAGLRAQVIHNDGHSGNILRGEGAETEITGLIDFGDMMHGALVVDLAISGACFAELGEAPETAVAALVQGFHGTCPLEPEELALLHDLILLRLILSVELLAFRRRIAADPAALDADFWWVESALRRVAALDPARAEETYRSACGLPYKRFPPSPAEDASLLARRDAALGPSYFLFYDQPVQLVRGRGVWLYDAEGGEYLDGYNNVASVGHCHPHVVGALARQAATLNTHTRYLHETVVGYAERLAATLPGDLSVCIFVCTGTEANDLALRIARSVTGQDGAIVVDQAYHGNSQAVTELSPSEYPAAQRPDNIATIAPPDPYRGRFQAGAADIGPAYAALVDGAIAELEERGHPPALFMCDAAFDGCGIFTAPEGYLQNLYAKVRAAGGLVVADEVQSGLGRLGDHLWGFQDSGVVPDIVTMGKPMGDGHPLGVLVTTPQIAAAFAQQTGYFNTFGGNPVSAAVGQAVLDVIEREEILQNVQDVGGYLRAGLLDLARRHDVIGDIRGKGLLLGVDLVADRSSKMPDPAAARQVVNALRANGVLIAASGPQGNVLKIRPPLVLDREHADLLLERLDRCFGF